DAEEGEAVHPGHLEVEGDDVRLEQRRQAEGLLAVRRFAHDLDLGVVREDLGDDPPVVGRVVHNEEPQGLRGHFALDETGFLYTKFSFKMNSPNAVETFNSDSAWPSKSSPPGKSLS